MSKYIGVVKVGFGRRVCPYRCGYGTNCQSGWILSGVFVARSSRSSFGCIRWTKVWFIFQLKKFSLLTIC